jgi:hypothetical protein
MTLSVAATIVRGQGSATANHRLLIPRIASHFPEVAKCNDFGTINVQLDSPLDRSRADFWTPQIPWIPTHLLGAKRALRFEAFGFIRILFGCPLHEANYSAWIILPEGSEPTYAKDRAEIIVGEFVPKVAYDTRCAIHLDHRPAVPAPPWFGEAYGKSLIQHCPSQ